MSYMFKKKSNSIDLIVFFLLSSLITLTKKKECQSFKFCNSHLKQPFTDAVFPYSVGDFLGIYCEKW